MAATKQTPPWPQMDALAAHFPGSDVRQRSGGRGKLTYISIDATIRRANEVLGPNWSVVPPTTTVVSPPPREGEAWFAKSEVYIDATIDGVQRKLYGVGCHTGGNPDDVAKTALAEGIKKAFHQVGVALYLWDEAGRKQAEAAMQTGTAAGRKKALKAIASERLGVDNPTLEQVAAAFEIEDADTLKTDAGITAALKDAGVL